MIQIVLIQKTGRLVNKKVKNISCENTYKYCNYTSDKNFEHVHTYELNNHQYEVYGRVDGRANTENKYEFPPPIDNRLFFGMMCILKKSKELGRYEDLSTMEWKLLYDKLFGGFEDLGDDDSVLSEDSEHSQSELTKEGYLKDGFVVDENNSTESDDKDGDFVEIDSNDDVDSDSDSDDTNFVTYNSKNEPKVDIQKINKHIKNILKKNNIDLNNMGFSLENFIDETDDES